MSSLRDSTGPTNASLPGRPAPEAAPPVTDAPSPAAAEAGRPRAGLARWWPLVLPAVLVLLGALATLVDLPLAQWFLAGKCDDHLRKVFDLAEVFGHGLGVTGILVALFFLDPPKRCLLPRLASCVIATGLAADVVKAVVERTRPEHFDFQGTVADTFTGWLPLWQAGAEGRSFPSGHVAAAAGLAVALAWAYPRARWFLAAMVVLVALQRMETGAHYLSDVLCGGALGFVVAQAFVPNGPLDRPFERLENWIRRRWGPKANPPA